MEGEARRGNAARLSPNTRGLPRVDAMNGFADVMSLAIEGSGTGLWDRNVVTGEIWYSRSWKAILGYGEAELSNHIEEAYTRVHPDDLSYVQATMQAHFEGRTDAYEVEHRLRCKDGTWKWVLSRGRVVARDASGHATRMVGTTTDVTATRNLAEQLQRTIDLITNLTDEIPGFMFQCRLGTDHVLTFGFASKAILDVFELPTSAALQRPMSIVDRIHSEDREAFHGSLRASATTLSHWHIEYRVVLPEQGLRWHQAGGKPSRQADGSTIWHGLITDITDRKRVEEELRTLARIDFLTQLPNRRCFRERMEVELDQIRHQGSPQAAVLMLDIDHFKAVNDHYGHAAGDDVIRKCAYLLRNEARWQDSAGRLGGEEFAVILPGAGWEEAEAFAARLRRRIAENPVEFQGGAVPFTVSIGITFMTSADETPDAALARADMALYRAKQAGRDRTEVCVRAAVPIGFTPGSRKWRPVAAPEG